MYVSPFVLDVARVGLWLVILLVLFVPLERLFPDRRRPVWRMQFSIDLFWYFLNNLVTPLLLTMATAVVAVGLHRLLPVPTWHMPLWARIVGTVLVGELGFYWGHRWSHEIPLLWRFHRMHHTAEDVDFLTSARGHPIDIVFTRLCGFVPVYLVGLAQINGSMAQTAGVSLLMIVGNVWGYFIHANLRWRFGWLEQIVSTPAFHRWHHVAGARRDHNYAPTLPIYDRLFGTFHLPKTGTPARFGIEGETAGGLADQIPGPFARPSAQPAVSRS